MMKEAQDIAQKLGVTFRVSIDKRIAGAESVGAHKTSMLQDVEAGRSLETEALIGSILEMAKLTNTPAPAIESVYALVKLLNKVMLTGGRRREGGENRQGGLSRRLRSSLHAHASRRPLRASRSRFNPLKHDNLMLELARQLSKHGASHRRRDSQF